jgi:hypothetical protein
MRELSNRAFREALGIPGRRFAVVAGVDRTTLRLYEANPEEVRDDTRERIERTYETLREAVRSTPGGPRLLKGA